MATLDYNEIKEKTYIIYEDEPYEVVESHVARKQKRKPQNQTKLKSLISGKVIPVAFHSSETAEEAEISNKDVKFLYESKGEYWFVNPEDPKDRFQISSAVIGTMGKWLKTDTMVKAMVFEYDDEEKIIGIKMPAKVTLTVTEAPPNMRGNTSSGGGKLVTLETGAQVTVPFFIETDEKIVINTETGEYVERYQGDKK